jgi:hypothetical protein
MAKIYVNTNDICKINTSNKKNNKSEDKFNEEYIKNKEPVLIDKVYDDVKSVDNENNPRCIEFKIKDQCELPFNCKVEILETTITTKVKKLGNKIFIQGREIDFDNDSFSNEPNIINLDESLINICRSKKYPKFALKVNEWVEACVEIDICIKAVAYVDDCDEEICFEAVGCIDDELCIPLMYTICVPNFIENDDKPYLKQTNEIQGIVDQSFIFLSPLPDCDGNIEKLLGKLVVTYCVSSNIESIIPNYVQPNKNKNIKNKKIWTTCDEISVINNKKRA